MMRWHRQLVLCCFHMLIRALHGYEMYKLYNFEYNMESEVETNYCKDRCLYSKHVLYDTFSCLRNPAMHEFTIDDEIPDIDIMDSLIYVTGVFNCGTIQNDTYQETIQIILNKEPLTDPIPVANSDGGQCWCSNCHTSHTLRIPSQALKSHLIRSHNATNTLSLSIGTHNTSFACLSTITLELHFNVPEFTGTSISPHSGPTTGHTNVTVTLAGSPPDLPIYCVFDEYKTLGRRLGQNTLMCRTSYSFPGIVEFSLALYLFEEYYFVPSFAQFQFYYEAILTKVVPYYGPTKGGTLVSVHGNFEYTSTCVCLFSLKSVVKSTRCVSTSNFKEVSCITPPWENQTKVDLSISLNGQQHSTKLKFYYTDKGTLSQTTILTIIICGCITIALILVVIVLLIIHIKRNKNKSVTQTLVSSSQLSIKDLDLKERIGRGRFSEVYRAIWHGTTVAAKKLMTGRIDDRFTSEFEKEVYLMSNLRAPNVLQFLGTVYEPPNVIIIVEYMSRGSLYQVLHDPSVDLGWDVVLSMLADTSRGMNYLHECRPPVIHRDLKSHNLLVDEYWRVKVCDFGLSTVMSNVKKVKSKKDRKKKKKSTPTTNTNAKKVQKKRIAKKSINENVEYANIINDGYDDYDYVDDDDDDMNGALYVDGGGTPYWTAPEVIKGLPASTKSDVYSFGIVMWECATRKVPYDGMPPFKVIYAMGTKGIRPQIPQNIPFVYSQLMKRCWDDDTNFRPEFSTILDTLEQMTPYNWKRIPRPQKGVKSSKDKGDARRESSDPHSSSQSPPYSPSISPQISSSVPTPPRPPSMKGIINAKKQARMAYPAKFNEKSPLLPPKNVHVNNYGGNSENESGYIVGYDNDNGNGDGNDNGNWNGSSVGFYCQEIQNEYKKGNRSRSGSGSGYYSSGYENEDDSDYGDDYDDYIYVNDNSGFNINGDNDYI